MLEYYLILCDSHKMGILFEESLWVLVSHSIIEACQRSASSFNDFNLNKKNN
jgi:hypothetical protein